MPRVRRRVLRAPRLPSAAESRRLARLAKKRTQLSKERAALTRWMSKLKRAFHSVEKLQSRIGWLERDIVQLE